MVGVPRCQCDQIDGLCSNIWPFASSKICHTSFKICQSRSKMLPNKNKKIAQDWRFCQSGEMLPNLVTLLHTKLDSNAFALKWRTRLELDRSIIDQRDQVIIFGSMHKCMRTQNSKNQLINKSTNPSDKNITGTGHLCTRRGSSSSLSTAQAGSERRYPDRRKCIRHKRKIRTGPWPRTGRWLVHADHRRENTSSWTSRRFLKY